MSQCANCGTNYSNADPCCRWCQERREELLERLQPDNGTVSLAVVASWAVQGIEEAPEKCWEVR
jgi:uncharacterized OB-fold protein